jgi:hypothetical protein
MKMFKYLESLKMIAAVSTNGRPGMLAERLGAAGAWAWKKACAAVLHPSINRKRLLPH